VAIVCSTGIAATNYTEFGAKTVHKWSGIEDGRHLDEKLIHLVKTDERFLSAKNNIETVQTLIVDEISMIGAKVLNQVQLLCKTFIVLINIGLSCLCIMFKFILCGK
jgi:uncharacterized iron-regulated protein